MLDCFFSDNCEGSSRDLFERVWSGTFENGVGDVGKDTGDDIRNGEVRVPKLDGRDSFDSEVTKDFTSGKEGSSAASVHRTVGRDILSESFLVGADSSFCSISDISICK